MSKSKRLWIIIICLVCIVAGLIAAVAFSQKPQEPNIYELTDNILDALGEEYKQQVITQLLKNEYADAEGNTIVYYLCVTGYSEMEPPAPTALNMYAICAVFDPDTAKEVQEASVNDCPAAFYHTGGLSYLCWTMTPHFSCILQYDPAVITEADILRMAESVPLVTE